MVGGKFFDSGCTRDSNRVKGGYVIDYVLASPRIFPDWKAYTLHHQLSRITMPSLLDGMARPPQRNRVAQLPSPTQPVDFRQARRDGASLVLCRKRKQTTLWPVLQSIHVWERSLRSVKEAIFSFFSFFFTRDGLKEATSPRLPQKTLCADSRIDTGNVGCMRSKSSHRCRVKKLRPRPRIS